MLHKSLLTFEDNSVTALDYEERSQNSIVGSPLLSSSSTQSPQTLSEEPAPEGDSDDVAVKQSFYNNNNGYFSFRHYDRQGITGASAPSSSSRTGPTFAERCRKSGICELFSACQITQPEEMLNIICKHTEITYSLSELEAPSHSWSDRFDLEEEETENHGGAATFQCLPMENHGAPSIPQYSFGRGKLREHEKDPKRYLYDGFLPVRGLDFDTLPHAERTAIEWREFIENE